MVFPVAGGVGITGAAAGFGPANITLREIMLEAAGKNKAWTRGKNNKNRILNRSQTDLNDASIATINQVLNSPYDTGAQYNFHGAAGDFTMNSYCYQIVASIQAADTVIGGLLVQGLGPVVTSWNLSSSEGGNPDWLVNLGSFGSATNFWGFHNGVPY